MLQLADNARRFSCELIEQMTNLELLEAIWSFESTYKEDEDDHVHDHRRYLQRSELKTIFHLARRRAQLKAEAGKPV